MSFNDWLSGMNNSIVQSPTMMLTVRSVYASEFPRDLIDRIGFDDVPGLDVVEILDADPTLVTLLHFTDIVLKASERPQFPLNGGNSTPPPKDIK